MRTSEKSPFSNLKVMHHGNLMVMLQQPLRSPVSLCSRIVGFPCLLHQV